LWVLPKREGVDFVEIFSHVVKHSSIRILLAMVAHFDMELEEMDVKTTFLHGKVDETIYMKQPTGFVKKVMNRRYLCSIGPYMVLNSLLGYAIGTLMII